MGVGWRTRRVSRHRDPRTAARGPRFRPGLRCGTRGDHAPVPQRWEFLLLVPLALGTIGWLGAERDRAAEGNRLYDAGRYDEAVTAYGEGLSDYPESHRLRFNLAAAQYRNGDFADALATLGKLIPALPPGGSAPATPGPLAGPAAYNAGNARVRLAEQLEEQDPRQAIALYEEALTAYKQAMAHDPRDEDPKYNHELVVRQLAALKKRLEEEQQRQQEQEQQQEQAEQQQEEQAEQQQEEQAEQQQEEQAEQPQSGSEGEQEEGDEQAEQDAGEEPPAEEEQAEADAGPEGQAPEAEEGTAPDDAAGVPPAERAEAGEQSETAAGGGETTGDEGTDRMTAADARALIDAARGEEVDPAEVQRRITVPAAIGEPEHEW